jgi:hypothetical protein
MTIHIAKDPEQDTGSTGNFPEIPVDPPIEEGG